MDPTPFLDIPVYAHDLLMVYDYNRLSRTGVNDLASDSYKQLHLVAWSMGVWTAAFSLSGQTVLFTTTTAINGTLSPIDDKYGIEPGIYSEMISNFSSSALHAFYRRMFIDPDEADRFFSHKPKRQENDILNELVVLMQHYSDEGPADNIFNRHIVGSRDRIFPARNQVRSWGRDECSIITAPHFPFYGWSSWDSLIAGETGTYGPE